MKSMMCEFLRFKLIHFSLKKVITTNVVLGFTIQIFKGFLEKHGFDLLVFSLLISLQKNIIKWYVYTLFSTYVVGCSRFLSRNGSK